MGLFILILAGCGKGSGKIPSTEVKKEVFKTTSVQLFRNYAANEAATDEAMKGKIIEVSGTVQSLDKDVSDNTIALKSSNQFMPSRLQMDDSEKAKAMTVEKGSKITIQCEKMSRLIGSPYGEKCHFL